jgi:hypothetical protein
MSEEDRFDWLTERIFPNGVTRKCVDARKCRYIRTRLRAEASDCSCLANFGYQQIPM